MNSNRVDAVEMQAVSWLLGRMSAQSGVSVQSGVSAQSGLEAVNQVRMTAERRRPPSHTMRHDAAAAGLRRAHERTQQQAWTNIRPWARWRRSLGLFNICIQAVALTWVMGNGSPRDARDRRCYTCIVADRATVDRDLLNLSSCVKFLGRTDLHLGPLVLITGSTLLITYPVELLMRLLVHPHQVLASLWLVIVYAVAAAMAFIIDDEGDYVRLERFLRLTSVNLFGVFRFLPVYNTLFQASGHILRALFPLVVFMLVAAASCACVMGLDSLPFHTENSMVSVSVEDHVLGKRDRKYEVPIAEFCSRSNGCLERPYFLNFPMSLFTMLQISTGDGWASGISWPVYQFLHHTEEKKAILRLLGFAVYVGVYTLIVANFVTAVIVDLVIDHMKQAKDGDAWIHIEEVGPEPESEERASARDGIHQEVAAPEGAPAASSDVEAELLAAVNQLAAHLNRVEAKVEALMKEE